MKSALIEPDQTWEPKRGVLWARVLRLAGDRVYLEKYAPDGDYTKCGCITGPYSIDIAVRSFWGDYRLHKGAR